MLSSPFLYDIWDVEWQAKHHICIGRIIESKPRLSCCLTYVHGANESDAVQNAYSELDSAMSRLKTAITPEQAGLLIRLENAISTVMGETMNYYYRVGLLRCRLSFPFETFSISLLISACNSRCFCLRPHASVRRRPPASGAHLRWN